MALMAMNYEDEWWARLYDSIYWATRRQEHDFYVQQASTLAEPVLEAACGTGTVLLDLLHRGVDAYGFDISEPMLHMLRRKLADDRREQTFWRVNRQSMVDFNYPSLKFGTVLIPSGSFLFLLTQADQIACLTNIHRHLRSGGRLLLNFAVPSYEPLASMAKQPQPFSDFGEFQDSLGGSKVRVSCKTSTELAQQLFHMDWRFESGSEVHDAAMCFRWVFPEEFKLLLRLAGFATWEASSGFSGEPLLSVGVETVWSAFK
jgi:SAM-dependent methyltransferase